MGVLRLLLAVAVVISHSAPMFGLRLTGGAVAVQAFYIISGFYMSLILNEKYSKNAEGTKLFYTNRFLRIYPTYWAILAIAIGLSLAAVKHGGARTLGVLTIFIHDFANLGIDKRIYLIASNISLVGLDWGYFLRLDLPHLAFSTDFYQHHPWPFLFDFVPQAWTLGLEVTVYAIAPLIFRRGPAIPLSIVAISAIARAYATRAGLQGDPWSYRFLPFEIGLFSLGSVSYHAYRAITRLRAKALGICAGIAIAALTVAYPALPGSPAFVPGFAAGQLCYLLAVAAAIPSIFALTRSSRWDRRIGDLSYPVYLCQLIAIPLCNGSFGPGDLYPIVGSLVMGCAIVVLVDRPLDQFRQFRVRSAAAPAAQYAAAD